MKLDPRHLVQLATIVQSGSFNAAAEQLEIAQPALSKNMKKLEERLKAPLFERIGRRSVPTELGLIFAQFGLSIQSAGDDAATYAKHFSLGHAGSLQLGTTPTLADNFLAPFLTDFLTRYVNCRVELSVGLLGELETRLRTGQINIVIGPIRPLSVKTQLETELLVDDTVGVLCRAGHPLTKIKEIEPEHLEAQRWIMHSKGSYLRMQTEDALGKFGVGLVDVALDTDSTETAYKAVIGGDFITALPRLPSILSPYSDRIRFLPLSNTAFSRPIGIIQRVSHLRSALETQLLRHLKREVGKIRGL